MPNNRPVIEIKDLSFFYPGAVCALKDVNLTVNQGESVAIVGHNGAGKTTLVRHLVGLHFAKTGHVHVDGINVRRENLAQVREIVGMVAQNPDDQLFCPSVREDVEFGPINMGLPLDEVKSRADGVMQTVGISKLADKPAHHLSGGQKKRVAIASILAMRPKVLIMDEPTANLDPANEKILTDLIKGLDCTKIIISHDLPILFQICKRVVVMHQGQVKRDCSMQEFMHDKDLICNYGLDFRFKCRCCRKIHPQKFA